MAITYEKDNKERVPFEHYLAEFQKTDPAEVSARTGAIWSENSSEFFIIFMGVEYAIHYPDFSIRIARETDQPTALTQISAARTLMIRFLNECCKAGSTGKYLTYREVPWGEVYYRQFSGRCLARLAYSYGNRLEAFSASMEKLGAKKISAGDAGYEIELFDGYFIRFQLWSGDEEFPPSAQILFSDNFAAAFHAEDLVVACDVIIGAMKLV